MAKGRVKKSTLMKSKGGQRILSRETAKTGSGRTTKIGGKQAGKRKGYSLGGEGKTLLTEKQFKRKQAVTKAKNVAKRGFKSAKQRIAALANLKLAWAANRKKK